MTRCTPHDVRPLLRSSCCLGLGLQPGCCPCWQALEALFPTEELAPLGRHLTLMPLVPRVGKMLIVGALLRCTSPVLRTAAAIGNGCQIFYSPSDRSQHGEVRSRLVPKNFRGSMKNPMA